MAQFLIVAHDASFAERIDRWLALNRAPQAQIARRRIGSRRLLILTPDPATEVYRGGYFRGTAVTTDGGCIAFGTPAWRRIAPAASSGPGPDGNHVRASWTRRELTVARDGFGSIALLHTEAPGLFAASDSLLVLTDLRRELGLPVTVNREVALARSRTLALTLQAMSPGTLINQIEFTPAGQALTATFGTEGTVRRTGRTVVERVFAPGPDWSYTDAVRAAAGRIIGTTGALVARAPTILQLSGGADSRLVLAAARRTGSHHRLRLEIIDRTEQNAPDAEVARDLAKRLGLPRPRGYAGLRPTPLQGGAIAIWASAHLGVYDRIVPDRSEGPPRQSVLLTGLSAGIAKGAYFWSATDGIRSRYLAPGSDRSAFAAERSEAMIAQFEAGVRAVGADPQWADASEWHYLAYRNGLHGGATSPVELSSVRPLQQWALASAGHQPDDPATAAPIRRAAATFLRSEQIIADMLALTDPLLASLRFAGAGSPSRPAVDARAEELGGALTDAEIMEPTIFGRPADITPGPFAVSVRIAERWGYDIGSDPDSIEKIATEWVDGIPDPTLRGIHRELLRLTRNELRKPGRIAMDAGSGPPKVLSAALLGL